MTDQNMPADWAIEQALERSKSAEGRPTCTWSLAGVKSEHFHRMAWAVMVVELARMIEKYEPELAPVDPDVLAVREILAARSDAILFPDDAKQYRDGDFDAAPDFVATLFTYRRVKSSG